jgi:hypothetical protein
VEIRPDSVKERGEIGVVIIHHHHDFVARAAGGFSGGSGTASVVASGVVASRHPAHFGVVDREIWDSVGRSICVLTRTDRHFIVA